MPKIHPAYTCNSFVLSPGARFSDANIGIQCMFSSSKGPGCSTAPQLSLPRVKHYAVISWGHIPDYQLFTIHRHSPISLEYLQCHELLCDLSYGTSKFRNLGVKFHSIKPKVQSAHKTALNISALTPKRSEGMSCRIYQYAFYQTWDSMNQIFTHEEVKKIIGDAMNDFGLHVESNCFSADVDTLVYKYES
ncbi:hypothetical protein B0H19DRAFT_1066486 [Mycena capillaripes]|nr:hypothetical protein B0H19DRAFT_1066486 [Mycena capillaripes]